MITKIFNQKIIKFYIDFSRKRNTTRFAQILYDLNMEICKIDLFYKCGLHAL